MTFVSIAVSSAARVWGVQEAKGSTMAVADRMELTGQELDSIAWDFLRSEFTKRIYAQWSIDRRFDVYLRHQGRDDLLNDGAAFDALLQRVMANIGRALKRGFLDSQSN